MKKTTIGAPLWPLCISGSGRVYNVWFSCLRFLHCCFLLLGVLLLAASPAQAEVKAGDILVVDQSGGHGRGALFLVDPTTGQRTVLSDFGNATQGSLGSGAAASVAVFGCSSHERAESTPGNRNPHWRIFVTELFTGEPPFGGILFGVDPDTGNRTVLSNFGQGDIQGPLYYGLAVDVKGKVIVNAEGASFPPLFDQGHPALVRVDPKNDVRVLVSDLTNAAQGPTVSGFSFITDLTLEDSGNILIGIEIFINNNTSEKAAIFRVSPVTGKRKLLSDFANPAQGAVGDLYSSTGLAVEASRGHDHRLGHSNLSGEPACKVDSDAKEGASQNDDQCPSGTILVASSYSGLAPRNLLFRIHPKTGQRTVLSDFDDPAQGPLGIGLHGVAVEDSGQILVFALLSPDPENNLKGALFRVDPSTGQRIVFSDFNNPAQGESGSGAEVYIAVVPDNCKAEGHD